MGDSESKTNVEDPTIPHWVNGAQRCSFVSATGTELGHVRVGEGLGRFTWFSFLEPSSHVLVPGGLSNREKAKELVELYFDLEQTVAFDSADKKDLER